MNSTDGTGVTTFATPTDLDIVVTRIASRGEAPASGTA